MKSYQYGFLVMGWMPAKELTNGGRFVMFRDRNEYEAAFRKEEQKQKEEERRVVYVETTKKPSLDSLIAAAGIRGGKGRYQIELRRGR